MKKKGMVMKRRKIRTSVLAPSRLWSSETCLVMGMRMMRMMRILS